MSTCFDTTRTAVMTGTCCDDWYTTQWSPSSTLEASRRRFRCPTHALSGLDASRNTFAKNNFPVEKIFLGCEKYLWMILENWKYNKFFRPRCKSTLLWERFGLETLFWGRKRGTFGFDDGSLRALRAMRRGAAQNEAEYKCCRAVVPVFLISPVFFQ